MGYQLKPDSKVNVTIDKKNFVMFVKDKARCGRECRPGAALVAAMKTGSSLTVKATSLRGTGTTYSYSLAGLAQALKKIETCK